MLITYHYSELRVKNMAQTVADLLIDSLLKAGINRIYGIVGDSLNAVLDSVKPTEYGLSYSRCSFPPQGNDHRRFQSLAKLHDLFMTFVRF